MQDSHEEFDSPHLSDGNERAKRMRVQDDGESEITIRNNISQTIKQEVRSVSTDEERMLKQRLSHIQKRLNRLEEINELEKERAEIERLLITRK